MIRASLPAVNGLIEKIATPHNGKSIVRRNDHNGRDADYCEKGLPYTTVNSEQSHCRRCESYCKDYVVILIEARGMFRECLVRSVREYLPDEILAFASVTDWLLASSEAQASVVILSIGPGRLAEDLARRELSALSAAIPDVPVVVLSDRNDLGEAVEAIGQGAKGYVSTEADFAIVMEAIHLVQVGGTYVPAECFLSTKHLGVRVSPRPPLGTFTSRELAVMQAIRQGKSNKAIAYDLNMCESTVKVHVRHIMKKLQARNRTEVAIKSSSLADQID